MPKGRGSFFIAMKSFTKKRFGPEGWGKVMHRLSQEDREQIESATTIGWFEMDLRTRALQAFKETFNDSGHFLIKEMGAFEAERDLNTTQRLFLRLANPGYALQKAGQYWRRFYDWGEFKVERKSKNFAIGTIIDNVNNDPIWCIHFQAYIHKVFELVGAKDIKIEHTTCCCHGDEFCVFEVNWK
jgi:hypothetical protein